MLAVSVRRSVCHAAQLGGACSVCGVIRCSLCLITLASYYYYYYAKIIWHFARKLQEHWTEKLIHICSYAVRRLCCKIAQSCPVSKGHLKQSRCYMTSESNVRSRCQQYIPGPCSGHWKRSIAECGSSCCRHGQETNALSTMPRRQHLQQCRRSWLCLHGRIDWWGRWAPCECEQCDGLDVWISVRLNCL